MAQGNFEPKDIRTGVAPDHSNAAKRGQFKKISNTRIVQSKKKYVIDPNSPEYKDGYQNFLENRHYGNPYSGRTEYGKYTNYNAGVKQVQKEIKMYGRTQVSKYYRFNTCLLAIGKPENEVRKIIKHADGNVDSHEIRAVLLRLWSPESDGFNVGVDAALKGGKSVCPYSIGSDRLNYFYWYDGKMSTELAIRLHGRDTVIQSL